MVCRGPIQRHGGGSDDGGKMHNACVHRHGKTSLAQQTHKLHKTSFSFEGCCADTWRQCESGGEGARLGYLSRRSCYGKDYIWTSELLCQGHPMVFRPLSQREAAARGPGMEDDNARLALPWFGQIAISHDDMGLRHSGNADGA